jgi:hypothetical protein
MVILLPITWQNEAGLWKHALHSCHPSVCQRVHPARASKGAKTNMPEPSTRGKSNLRQSTTDSSQDLPNRVQPVKPIRGEAEQVVSAKVIAWKQVSEQRVDDVTQRASQALDEIGQRMSAAYERVQTGITDAYERSKWKSEEVARRARTRARLVVDQYPLHLIAGVAGAAFVAGIVLRVWRSSRYE